MLLKAQQWHVSMLMTCLGKFDGDMAAEQTRSANGLRAWQQLLSLVFPNDGVSLSTKDQTRLS
jgi:hypothetical protein